MDRELLEAMQQLMAEPGGGVLAIITRTAGSVPRESGAKMVIFADGRTAGTIGGGALEKHAVELAAEVLAEGRPRTLDISLERDLGMACGGEVTLFLEPIIRGERLVIFGGGHIGLALFKICPLMCLQPVIVDERPDYAAAERFPGARTVCAEPGDAAHRLAVGEEDFVIVVTHQHHNDLEAVRAVIGRHPRYLGMIGSRRKVAGTMETLRSDGVPEDELARIRAPIGLNLGGRSPGEIAVAIAGEIIALRAGKDIPPELGW